MSASSASSRYRAPACDRGWLIALSDEEGILVSGEAESHELQAAWDHIANRALQAETLWQGRTLPGLDLDLAELRTVARREWWLAAHALRDSTSQSNADAILPHPPGPLILTGHQPELAHPGVWVKSLAAQALARRIGGWSAYLLVDTDLLESRTLRVPLGDARRALLTTMPFDMPHAACPWSEAHIGDDSLFRSFGSRVSEAMQKTWSYEPLISRTWQDAVIGEADEPLSLRFSRMRQRQEARWGVVNQEVLLSRWTRSQTFQRFFESIVQRAEEFRDCYNRVVLEYRQAHRIRSQSHPASLLTKEEGRIELPFWIWRSGDHRRQPLFARRSGWQIALSTRGEVVDALPVGTGMPTSLSTDDGTLGERLHRSGWVMAPRALATTLLARIWLGDLFIHGIGGARYDEMSDRIIREFYRLPVPPYLVLSATLRLPIETGIHVSQHDLIRQMRLLRELTYHPERHLAGVSADPLVYEKQSLVNAEQPRLHGRMSRAESRAAASASRERWKRLSAINRELAGLLTERRMLEQQTLDRLRVAWGVQQVLGNRDYSAWLHPEESLREFFAPLVS